MNIAKKWTALLCVCLMLLAAFGTAPTAEAASGPSLRTTLTDNATQRGSKKTFDVWARNAAGSKIKATVKFNGEKLNPTWDDNEKSSYTLVFTQEGENVVTVSASSDGGQKQELTYHITYRKAAAGEAIGSAVWSVEAFTLGSGYVIPPVRVPIYEGETSADQLIRLLHSNGLIGYYGGTTKASFYLAYIADGTVSAAIYNGYQKSGTAKSPRALDLHVAIPQLLTPHLQRTMTFFDPDDYEKNWRGYLGEFVISNGSGWMYCVNNVFPNVGFADTYLSDGDVVRVQFTLGYGADIGGFGAMGTSIPNVDSQPTGAYYAVANKDSLTRAICGARASGLLARANVAAAYDTAVQTMATLNASAAAVQSATQALRNAVAHPSAVSSAVPPSSAAPSAPASSAHPASSAGTSSAAPSAHPASSSAHSSHPAASEPASSGSDSSGADSSTPDTSVLDTSVTDSSVPAASAPESAGSGSSGVRSSDLPASSSAESPSGGAPVVLISAAGVLLLAGIAAGTVIFIRRRKESDES